MWSNRASQALLDGMQEGRPRWKTIWWCLLSYSYQQSSNCASWYLPKRAEKLCPRENLLMGIYSSFNHNCQNLEPIKISFNRWMNKQCYIQSVQYFSVLRWRAIKPSKIWRNLKYLLLRERCQSENAISYDSAIWHCGKGKTIETVGASEE